MSALTMKVESDTVVRFHSTPVVSAGSKTLFGPLSVMIHS